VASAKKATKPSAPAKSKPSASTSKQSAKAPSKSPTKGASKAVSIPTKASPKKAATPAAKSTPAKQPAKAPAKSPAKHPAAKTPATKTSATKTPASKTPATKTPASKTPSSKTPAKQAAKPAEKQPVKQPAKPTPASPAAATTVVDGIPKPKFSKDGLGYTKDFDLHFVKAQYELLQHERAHLTGQAHRLEAEAHQLVEEAEMGDVQFDDEGGEGDTMVVERERDLALSAQARDAVAEIDAALERITVGTYGYSVLSGRPIPKERLEAIPWSSVLVEEKVGGIGRR
jgi:RNA polymerase-binding transcription factor DksA